MRANIWTAGVLVAGLGLATAARAQSPGLLQPERNANANPRPRAAEPGAIPPPAQPAPAPAAAPAGAGALAKMDALLKAWANQSAKTKTLDAEYDRVDFSPDWKVETRYKGRALLQSPNLACIDLKKVAKPEPTFYERIICAGDKVYHYQGPTKQIYIYPLDVQDRQQALQQGPLPFMFNMNVENAKRRYRMTLLGENATQYQVRIVPLLKEDREAFIDAQILLSKSTFLPERLVLVEPNGKDTQTYIFSKVKRDEPIEASNFVFAPVKGWTITNNPAPPPPMAGDAARPQPAAPVARPAMNPAQRGRR